MNNLDLDDFLVRLYNLLDFEHLVNYKKLNNIPLNNEEKIFDLYLFKPSSVLNLLLNIFCDKEDL